MNEAEGNKFDSGKPRWDLLPFDAPTDPLAVRSREWWRAKRAKQVAP